MLTADIARAIGVLAGAGDRPQRLVLRPYLGPQPAGDPEVNQFLLLLKPHALDVASGVDVARVLKTVQSVLTAWKVEVAAEVEILTRNPEVVVDGRAVPAFDLSEDLDTSDLAAILGNVRVAPEPVEEGL